MYLHPLQEFRVALNGRVLHLLHVGFEVHRQVLHHGRLDVIVAVEHQHQFLLRRAHNGLRQRLQRHLGVLLPIGPETVAQLPAHPLDPDQPHLEIQGVTDEIEFHGGVFTQHRLVERLRGRGQPQIVSPRDVAAMLQPHHFRHAARHTKLFAGRQILLVEPQHMLENLFPEALKCLHRGLEPESRFAQQRRRPARRARGPHAVRLAAEGQIGQPGQSLEILIQQTLLVLPEHGGAVPLWNEDVRLRVIDARPGARLDARRVRPPAHRGTEEAHRRVLDRPRVHAHVVDRVDFVLNGPHDARERQPVESVG